MRFHQPPKEGIGAVKVKPLNAHSFWVLPEQLSLPVPDHRTTDPLGFTAAERKLFDIVKRHQPITTAAIANLHNAGNVNEVKWTASSVGVMARRLARLRLLKMKRLGDGKSKELFTVEVA